MPSLDSARRRARLSATSQWLTLAAAVTCLTLPATAQSTSPSDPHGYRESIEVTATRVPEDVESVPASITVLSGKELRDRGATDLASALALVGGVAVAPGGDGGPAASVPELWGLREMDAFLLVVDGVPWGGAFNPALASLDLTGVERIEILRGSAPVMYGATSFVGVIHVIHSDAGSGERAARLSGGSYSSGSAAAWTPLPDVGRLHQSIIADGTRQGFRDDRTELARGHVLYRAGVETDHGRFHFDLDGTLLRQDPASPHPRQGQVLSPLVPLDANHNPEGARLDENRIHLVGGYDHTLAEGAWSTTVAVTDSQRDITRGFLGEDLEPEDTEAHGFMQDVSVTDVYFDSHVVLRLSPELHLVAGIDHLYGSGEQESEVFDYSIALDGSNPPDLEDLTPLAEVRSRDKRNFSGLYLQAEWTPHPRWRIEVGARLNHTDEERSGREEPVGEMEDPDAEEEGGEASRTVTRGSGIVGVNWLAWSRDEDGVWLYADYRNTFKPAAVDFGPEAEADILAPETAESWEVGLKGNFAGGRLTWDLSGFQMNMENLVVPQTVNGLPQLVNAGRERFRGAEVEAELEARPDLRWRFAWSLHDARFRDFVRLFDGEPFDLGGKRLELSARNMGGLGLLYTPARGWIGSVVVSYVGSRFLNQRNTAEADPYTTWSAGVGYRFQGWEVRVDGRNLNDTRPPVSESELGDAQYYLLPARSFELSWVKRF